MLHKAANEEVYTVEMEYNHAARPVGARGAGGLQRMTWLSTHGHSFVLHDCGHQQKPICEPCTSFFASCCDHLHNMSYEPYRRLATRPPVPAQKARSGVELHCTRRRECVASTRRNYSQRSSNTCIMFGRSIRGYVSRLIWLRRMCSSVHICSRPSTTRGEIVPLHRQQTKLHLGTEFQGGEDVKRLHTEQRKGWKCSA